MQGSLEAQAHLHLPLPAAVLVRSKGYKHNRLLQALRHMIKTRKRNPNRTAMKKSNQSQLPMNQLWN